MGGNQMTTKVSIVKGSKNPQENEIRAMVERAIDLIDGIDGIVSKGDRVLIKPNIAYELKPGETEVSDPRVAKAVYDIFSEMGTKPIIGESSAAGVDGEAALRASGYYDLRDKGYDVVNLKEGKAITLDNPQAKVLKKAKVFQLAKEVDAIINLPVIKTHDHEPATLSLKNMKGVMPDTEKKRFHKEYGLFQAIADLNLLVRPQLTIVDGIFCREGLGYPWSEEIEMDLIIAGKDPVAVDTVTLLVMGIDPKQQKHAVLAEEHGIGSMNMNKIQVVGEKIDNVKRTFKRPAEALQTILRLHDFKLLSDERMCTGCRGMMFYFLKAMEEQGKLDQITEFTFVMGEHDSLPELDKEKAILIGVCLERYKGLGKHVPGCPPLSSDVMTEVFEAKTKPVYSSD
jgi:uncharacterized protein (DUF362 family)